MKFSLFCLVIINITFTKSNENENTFNNKGWRPISNAEAYRGFTRSFAKPNNVQYIDTARSPPEYMIELIERLRQFKNNAIKAKPQHVYSEFVIREGNGKPDNVFTETSTCDTRDDTNCDTFTKQYDANDSKGNFENDDKTDDNTNNTIRRAKKLIDDVDENINNQVLDPNIELEAENKNIGAEIISKTQLEDYDNEDYRKSYAVTEKTASDFNAEETIFEKDIGYVYDTPKKQSPEDQEKPNLTNIFLDILSKYNLNSKDELKNYEKSRISNSNNNYKPQFIYLPIPLRYLDGYNTLNHAPINPIQAVLLSNYGYYSPGSYGLRNNYRNLYGYLASNNIHNNKPFGVYKVFSDTDSSN